MKVFCLHCITIFNPSGLCLLKGNKVPSPCVFCDHTTGGLVPRTYLLHEESVLRKQLQKIQFWFSIPIPGFSIPIQFSIPPISIPIQELELELTCNSNSGIELTPTLAGIFMCGMRFSDQSSPPTWPLGPCHSVMTM